MKIKFPNKKSLTNNKKRKAAKIIIILLLFLISYTIFHINIAPKLYLSKKYDTVYSSIQIEKYHPSKLISDFSFKNIFDIDSSPSSNYFCTENGIVLLIIENLKQNTICFILLMIINLKIFLIGELSSYKNMLIKI